MFGQGVPVRAGQLPPSSSMIGAVSTKAALNSIPCIVPELGGGSRIWEELVQDGINGAKNVLIGLGMLQDEPVGQEKKQIICKSGSSIMAGYGGIVYNACKLNDVVKKGAKIGVLKDIAGQVLEEMYAPHDSILCDTRYQPTAYAGEWLYACGKIE